MFWDKIINPSVVSNCSGLQKITDFLSASDNKTKETTTEYKSFLLGRTSFQVEIIQTKDYSEQKLTFVNVHDRFIKHYLPIVQVQTPLSS